MYIFSGGTRDHGYRHKRTRRLMLLYDMGLNRSDLISQAAPNAMIPSGRRDLRLDAHGALAGHVLVAVTGKFNVVMVNTSQISSLCHSVPKRMPPRHLVVISDACALIRNGA